MKGKEIFMEKGDNGIVVNSYRLNKSRTEIRGFLTIRMVVSGIVFQGEETFCDEPQKICEWSYVMGMSVTVWNWT